MRGIASRRRSPAGRVRPCVAIAVLVTASACGDHAGPAAGVTVADSAGITIVTNPPLAGLPRFEVAPEPLVGIGVLEGDPSQQLHRVTGGLVRADGGIVVLNAGSSEVRWYDAEGGFVRSQGREGSGPGEYRAPEGLFVYRGDSLAVWDDQQRRLTLLNPAGNHARDVTPRGDLARASVLGAFADGSLALLDRRFDVRESGDYQDFPGPTLVYDPEGAPTGDTISNDRWMTARMVSGEGFVELHGLALERPPARAVAADALWVGDPRLGELRRYAPGGSGLTRIVRWPPGDRAVTQEIRDAYTQGQLDAAPNEEVRQAILRTAGSLEFAELVPALAAIGVSADGRIWVQAFDPPGGPERPTWWVFDGEGQALRTVELPTGAEPLWSAGERVLLRLRDDLDVERVELRELRPAGEA